MNSELQLALLNIGKSDSAYSEKMWYQIIDSLLDDFQIFIGCNFE